MTNIFRGYLLALGLMVFVLGFLLAKPGSGFYEQIGETAKEPLPVIVFAIAVYVLATRVRTEEVTRAVLAKDGSVSFLTDALAADSIERIKIRPSMFRDLVIMKVKMKNGNVITRTCDAKSAHYFLTCSTPYAVDSRTFPFYLMYVVFILGMFICGVLWAIG